MITILHLTHLLQDLTSLLLHQLVLLLLPQGFGEPLPLVQVQSLFVLHYDLYLKIKLVTIILRNFLVTFYCKTLAHTPEDKKDRNSEPMPGIIFMCISKVLLSISSLLTDANPDDSLVTEIAHI